MPALKQKGSCKDCGCTPCEINPCNECCRCVPRYICVEIESDDLTEFGRDIRSLEWDCENNRYFATMGPGVATLEFTLGRNSGGSCTYLILDSPYFNVDDDGATDDRLFESTSCRTPAAVYNVTDPNDSEDYTITVTTIPMVANPERLGCDGCSGCGCLSEEIVVRYTDSAGCVGYEVATFDELIPGWQVSVTPNYPGCSGTAETITLTLGTSAAGACTLTLTGPFTETVTLPMGGAKAPCPLFEAEFDDGTENVFVTPHGCAPIEGESCSHCLDATPSEYTVTIAVTDNGCGNCPELLDGLELAQDDNDLCEWFAETGNLTDAGNCGGGSFTVLLQISSTAITLTFNSLADTVVYSKTRTTSDRCEEVHTLTKQSDTSTDCTWPSTCTITPGP